MWQSISRKNIGKIPFLNIVADKTECLKTDISNYFNSIDVMMLLPMLAFLQEKKPEVHDLLVWLLTEVDRFFEENGVLYLRYSDDILLFADSREELERRQEQLHGMLSVLGLSVNPDKASIIGQGEGFEFLLFPYRQGELDLSANTLHKTKAKIRRKSDALRRWQQKGVAL